MSVILWPHFCGDKSDEWSFWNENITWQTLDPDFTLCMQKSIFQWLPTGFLILSSIFYFPYLYKLPTKFHGNISVFNLAKIIITLGLILLSCLDFFKTITDEINGYSPKPVLWTNSIIGVFTWVFVAFLMRYEYIKGIHSSGVLFFFWLIQFLLGIITFRSFIRHLNMPSPDVYRSVTGIISYVIIVVLFLAHCFPDKTALDTLDDDEVMDDAYLEKKPLLSFQNGDARSSRKTKEMTALPKRMPCPETKSSFLAQLTFYWIINMIYTGYRRALTSTDLTDLRPEDTCAHIIPKMQTEWQKELDATQRRLKKKVSFLGAIARVFGWKFALYGFYKLVSDLITFLQPQILNLLIAFIDLEKEYIWRGYLYAVCLFLVAMMKTLIFQQYWHGCYVTGMRLRTAAIGIIYRKCLNLSGSARKETTVGEIVNLMSVDAQKLQEVPSFLHLLWSAPVTIAIALYFLWQELGPSSLAGLGVMILLIPVNAFLATKIRNLQYAQMKFKDKRIKLLSEMLSGIRVLKLYAWEHSFEEKILEIRKQEILVLRKAAFLNAGTSVCWFCAPFLVAISTFAVYVMVDANNVLTPNKAFVSLSLFNILSFPLSMLPGTIGYLVQAIVAVSRITKYLVGEEIDPKVVESNPLAEHPIKMENGYFAWGKDEEAALKNINLQIPDGGLVAVVGTVGSGKTSLVSAILGELHKIRGRVVTRGNIAYVPQQAWCQNATLQNNILFGKNMHTKKYDNVIECCALKPDIDMLPGGDQTEIGEKGINLSGGQKQRISLARAVYQDADIYLLDDPLSAVDSHVGKHIFEKVLGPKGMLAHKTRILVTHGLTYLSQVDCIVVMKEGQVSEIGTYQELLSHNGPFAEFIRQFLEHEDEESSEEEEDEEAQELKATLRRTISVLSGDDLTDSDGGFLSSGSRRRSVSEGRSRSRHRRKSSIARDLEVVKSSKNKLIQEEFSETGSVKFDVFLSYLRATGYFLVLFVIISYACYLGCQVGTNTWLSTWSEYDGTNKTSSEIASSRDFYLGIYGLLGAGQAIFIVMENFFIAFGTTNASKILHGLILKNILRAPSSFFDTTPLGRIINRFGKDIDTVDINIPISFRIWLATFASVLAAIIVISVATPQFLIAIIPLSFIYYFAQRFYVCTSRQLKRIDSVKRSPIYSHFQESIVGASSIRAYQKKPVFIGLSDKLTDENQMAWYPNIVSYRWLGVTLESIGNVIILLSATFAVIFREATGPGFAGLSVSYALQITGALNYMVRMTCDMETYIVAVERLKEYTDVVNEAPWELDYRPPSDWPTEGKVEFRDYSVRYRPGLELVLKGITAVVESGEKVGIVGRTGAGKSSLTLALFRILEPAGGTIVIDGVDICRIGLHDLRNKITIIPQDPVLFSGSLRMNLDPFDNNTDGEVWTVLEHAHLKTFVSSLPDGLNHMCSEGGENLSVGQRQLVCLARALLRKSRILVLDEATAAVDLETDDLIQSTIRREFKTSTVLTIAHRLNTIMDYDKVMVLDKGEIREFENPNVLLSDTSTIFYSMAHDANLV